MMITLTILRYRFFPPSFYEFGVFNLRRLFNCRQPLRSHRRRRRQRVSTVTTPPLRVLGLLYHPSDCVYNDIISYYSTDRC